MSMLNHMVVFRASVLRPDTPEDDVRTRRDARSSRAAPKRKGTNHPQTPVEAARIYALVAAGTLACAITAGIVAVAAVI